MCESLNLTPVPCAKFDMIFACAQVFKAASASPAANGRLLERLTHVRHDIAQLMGAPFYAQHQLHQQFQAC